MRKLNLLKGGAVLYAFGALVGAALLSTAQAQPARPLTIAVTVAYEGACDGAPPPGVTRLWLGHFRGGNAVRGFDTAPVRSRIFVDWADQYRCFSSRQRCQAWQVNLRRVYRGIESTRTCLPLR